MKAMNFQDDIPSIPSVNLKHHYVPVFDLTSMHDATENCFYPELVGEPLLQELNYTFPLEHVTELIVMGERMSRLQLTNLVLLGRISKENKVSPQQLINRIQLLKYRYVGSFPSDYVRFLPNETFAVIKSQSSNVHPENWVMIAYFCSKLYTADSLGQSSFFKQQYNQMMPQPVESHPNVCSFYTIREAFLLFKFRQLNS